MPKTALARRPSDRLLRPLLQDCRRLLSERGEANGPGIAAGIVQQIDALADEPRTRFFDHLARDFSPDPQQVLAAALAYAKAPAHSAHLIALTQAAEPPRQELFRRLNRAPGGTSAIVRLRRALLERLPRHPALAGVEHDMLHLLGSWFNPGFLQMRKVDWNSPAQLLEQIIHHEAVHQIDGWDDLRRRLQPDRRCFAFFHPQLPDEPLIFVEVALLREMAGGIVPLLDEEAAPADLDKAACAIFYSISNTQSGLKGVSFGDELIKRVVEVLQGEFARLKLFATLSPVPGFRAWLAKNADARLQALPARARTELARELGVADLAAANIVGALDGVTQWPEKSARARWLLAAAAHYLARERTEGGRPLDAVARFHLGNGARIERINWLGDPSPKGLKQSYGLMVNYLYDLKRLDKHRRELAQGTVPVAGAVQSLLD